MEPTEQAEAGETEGPTTLEALTLWDPVDPSNYSIIFDPEEGKKLVGVEVVVGNTSNESLSVNVLDFYLVDAEGFVYDVETGSVDGQIALVDLSQGEKVRGWVGFLVPPEAVPAKVKYEVGGWSGEYVEAEVP